jgi:hypothetical protein
MEALRLLFDVISWVMLGIITITSISLFIVLSFSFLNYIVERIKKVN